MDYFLRPSTSMLVLRKFFIVLFICLLLSAHVQLFDPCSEKQLKEQMLDVGKRTGIADERGYSLDNDCKLYMSHSNELGGGHDAVLVDRNGNFGGLEEHRSSVDSDLTSKYHIEPMFGHHDVPHDGTTVHFETEGRPYEGDLFMHGENDFYGKRVRKLIFWSRTNFTCKKNILRDFYQNL